MSKDLSRKNQKWLTLLSRDLDRADVERVVAQIESLTEDNEKKHVDSVLQVVMKENEKTFGQLKEEEEMCQALREFFEPEIREEVNKAVDKAVRGTEEKIIINALKAGNSVADISRIMQIPAEEIEAIAKKK